MPTSSRQSGGVTAMRDREDSLEHRIHLKGYWRQACIAALRGEAVPRSLGHPVHQLCTTRGIRYHPGFGTELHGCLPVFTRALNARDIMSDKIPEGMTSGNIPYCIWYPSVASEDTYRKLVRAYPQMAYHVRRACAVAGYIDLYKELDILPEVHIAEEARECGNMSIFDDIMSRPVRYTVMNDYELRIEDPRSPAHLNGDTAVRWMLDFKQQLKDPSSTSTVMEENWYKMQLAPFLINAVCNTTEDLNIDASDSPNEYQRQQMEKHFLAVHNRDVLQLLTEPLPADLPTVKKDLLINMAAYYGNIDRYTRLRRPKWIAAQLACCVRGIYHNPAFAHWWSKQPDPGPSILTAINARYIMSNMLAGAPFRPDHTPYLIWWPQLATGETYRHLATVQKNMHVQIVHACIYANNRTLFAELLPQITPTTALVAQAERSPNPHFRDALAARLTALALDRPEESPDWTMRLVAIPGVSRVFVNKYIDHRPLTSDFDGLYGGLDSDAREVELMACMPEDWLIAAEDADEIDREIDYKYWPPVKGIVADQE